MHHTQSLRVVLAIILLAPCAVEAQRVVDQNVLVSAALPSAHIAFDSTFTYVGTQSVVLFGRTDAEQHFFVDADGSRVRRMFWVQFEGKRPNNLSTYDYSRYPVLTFGGYSFFHDGRFFAIEEQDERPGSDFRHALAFLRAQGYHLGPEVMRQRLVWLDRPARNELMIIYYEDLRDHELSIADLASSGKAAYRWDEISSGLLKRALEAVRFSNSNHPEDAQ